MLKIDGYPFDAFADKSRFNRGGKMQVLNYDEDIAMQRAIAESILGENTI